jgi:hypothetical protein
MNELNPPQQFKPGSSKKTFDFIEYCIIRVLLIVLLLIACYAIVTHAVKTF